MNQIREDLKKLARLAASVSEAHTSAIFLPTGLFDAAQGSRQTTTSPSRSRFGAASLAGLGRTSPTNATEASHEVGEGAVSIDLVALHSSSTVLAKDCRIPVGIGLLGWVSQHGRSIHVAPFDLDSSTLGLYAEREPLKSLVAVPIPMPVEGGDERVNSPQPTGVLMCDSKRSVSFNKVQIKLLEDIAIQISRLLYWALVRDEVTTVESSWESFRFKLDQLADAIGSQSIEVVRVSIDTFVQTENDHGVSSAVHQSEQFLRLAQQALPPHFPLVRLPNGDIVIALDNMMSTFFQHKLRTLANHVGTESRPFSVSLQSFPARATRAQGVDIDCILQQRPSAVKTSTKSTIIVGGTRA